MKRWCAIFSDFVQRANKGFFLLELQLSLFLVLLLLALLANVTGLGWQGWSRITADAELRDTGRYILNRLEKDIGVSSVSVKLDGAAGRKMLELQTLESKHVVHIYCDKKRLYRKILNLSGSGVNPLYINNVLIEEWKVEPVDTQCIIISFWLSYHNNRRYFQRLIYCHNGVIMGYEM